MKHPSDLGAGINHWQKAGFGLYVHWPFCQSKCPYCDFNSHVADRVDQSDWAMAFASELARLGLETGPRKLTSIFFGGGTPSLMDPGLIEHIISEAGRRWSFSNDIEITLEANPTSVELQKFRAFRDAGVNRVSIGVQALNDTDLRRLGRMHGTTEALKAIETARSVFDRFSFDLIYARQDQSLAAWEKELQYALSLGSRHISLYQLTIEPDTVFGERFSRGLLHGLPNDDVSADMYAMTQEICEANGLIAYETSNHAQPGQESLHNMIYWQSGDFAAIGPGAHGRLTFEGGVRYATESDRSPAGWMSRVQTTGSGESGRERLTEEAKAIEYVVMGLRLADGIDLEELFDFSAHSISSASIGSLEKLGVLRRTGTRIQATQKGRILLNSVLAELEIISGKESSVTL